MKKEAEENGLPVEVIIVKGSGHGFRNKNADPTPDAINHMSVDYAMKYLENSEE